MITAMLLFSFFVLGIFFRQAMEVSWQGFDFYGGTSRHLFICIFTVWVLFFCTGCTMIPNPGKPGTDYPDSSTPPGFNEFNGGILADITVNGRGYNVVTPNAAAKVAKWQGNMNGFISTVYEGQPVTAIDKAVIFQFDIRP